MNMFNNLSSLQRRFIRNCFIALGVIAWIVFGFVSVSTYWDIGCLIFSLPFICFGVFIIIYGIRLFILRLRFKWQIMGVLKMEEYNCVMRDLWASNWDFECVYNTEENPMYLEVLDKVKPFWNSKLEG